MRDGAMHGVARAGRRVVPWNRAASIPKMWQVTGTADTVAGFLPIDFI